MSSSWQHFELVGVIGKEMTGWQCAGCEAHLTATERDGRTYGLVEHLRGCTELAVMPGQPREQLSATGAGRIGVLERRADLIEGSLGTADDVLKGLGQQVEGLRGRLDSMMTLHNALSTQHGDLVTSSAGIAARLAERCDRLEELIEAVAREQAQRSDGLDNRLTELEVEHRRPGGTGERLRQAEERLTSARDRLAELEKAVLNPRGTVVDQFRDVTARLARLELAVGGLVEHGEPGHAMPRPAAAGGPLRPSVQLSEWVIRVSTDGRWTEQDIRSAIVSGDTEGIEVHQMSFIGSVTTAGGGRGTADAAGEPGYVRVTGNDNGGSAGGSGR